MSVQNDTLRSYLAKAKVVNVDVALVEKNYPFKVFHRLNYKTKSGVLVHTYIIEMADVDTRWLMESSPAFELFFLGESEVLAKIPAFDYAFLHDALSEVNGKHVVKLVDQGDEDAINVVRNAIRSNPDRHFQFIRLVFPEVLDNKVFSPDTDNGKLKPRSYPVVGEWKANAIVQDELGNQTLAEVDKESNRVNIQWKIAVAEDQKRATIASTKAKNELQEQLEQFGGMSI